MSKSITVRITGLTALVRHRRGAKPRSQVMDAVMVKPIMKKMGAGALRTMPTHFPVLIAPTGSVRMEPPDLLKAADGSTVDLCPDTEAWRLEGLECRFQGAVRRQRPVTHVGEKLKSGSGVVTCHDLDDFAPLSMVANVNEAGEAAFDRRWLRRTGGKQSPVGARIRLSGGSIRCEPRSIRCDPARPAGIADSFWQLKSDDKSFPGRPLAEILTLTYPVPRGNEVKLEVATLHGQVVGAVYLSVAAGKFEFRNFPKPHPDARVRVGNGLVPPPFEHFDAFYNLLHRPVRRPLPYYWGRRALGRSAKAAGRLVVAAEESGQRPSSKDDRTGEASCPLGVVEV